MASPTRTVDAFGTVFGGGRRGLPLDDTLLAVEPSERAEDELAALLEEVQAGTRSLDSLAATLDTHRTLIDERPLLARLRSYLAAEVLAEEYAQAEPFVVAFLEALNIHDGDHDNKYMRECARNAVLHGSGTLWRRAQEKGGPLMPALRELAPVLVEEGLGPQLGWGMYGRDLEGSLRALATSDPKVLLRAKLTGETVERMARTLRAHDCETLGVVAVTALHGRRPTKSPTIRRLVALPVLKEAMRLMNVTLGIYRAEAAEKTRRSHEFFHAECDRIARVNATLPENASPDEVFRAYACDGFSAEDERVDAQLKVPYVIRADALYHAAKPCNRTSIARKGLTPDRDGEVFVTQGLSGYSDNPECDLWEVDPTGLKIEREDVGEDELVIQGAVPSVNLRLVLRAENRPPESPRPSRPRRRKQRQAVAAQVVS